jgi:hypothetical protein
MPFVWVNDTRNEALSPAANAYAGSNRGHEGEPHRTKNRKCGFLTESAARLWMTDTGCTWYMQEREGECSPSVESFMGIVSDEGINVKIEMRTKIRLQTRVEFIGAIIALLGCLLVPRAYTQGHGYNAVCYNSSGTANDCSTPTSSPAFIDASVYNGSSSDVCAQIQAVFQFLLTNPPPGAVIDARGVKPAPNGGFPCANGTPWFDGTTHFRTPAEVLLPAGVITINQTWVLPNNTRVFGAGGYGALSAGFKGTTLQACSIGVGSCLLSSSNPVMVQFGDNGQNYCTNGPCTGISMEYVDLDGEDSNRNPQVLTGVLNQNAQIGSYVNQMTITNIGGSTSAIGLQIGGSMTGQNNAQYSGPYSNIFFTGKTTASTCVEIYQSGTLGLHGITCTTDMYPPLPGWPAIYLDASNTTIKDAHIENFDQGIWVGSNQPAAADTFINVSAGGAKNQLSNIIHICGPMPLTSFSAPGPRTPHPI